MIAPRFVDVHSHVVPSGDDGAASVEEGLQLCRAAANAGTRVLYATPQLPRLTSDPDDDQIAATAIYGRAEAIVTSEKALLDDGSFEHEGHSVEVMSFDDCVSRIENASFSLSQVPEILSIPTRPGLPPISPMETTRNSSFAGISWSVPGSNR